MFCQTIKIPMNYKIEEHTQAVHFEKARGIIKSKKIKGYESLTISENEVKFKKPLFICPYCNSRTPALTHYFKEELSSAENSEGIMICYKNACNFTDFEAILEMCKPQISLFDAQNKKTIKLSNAINPNEAHICPVCKKSSNANDISKEVVIEATEKRVTVAFKIDYFFQLFDEISKLKIKSKFSVSESDFPIYEVLNFDIEKHDSALELRKNDGQVLAGINPFESETYINDIFNNKIVLRTLKKAFLSANLSFPFNKYNLNIDKFFMITKFSGHSKEFYNSIPFTKTSLLIDKSFEDVSKKLVTPEDALKLYNDSTLPKCKSVKRIIYNNLGILFYIDTLEKIWKMLGDVNIFVALLNNYGIFSVLSFLHSFPCTIELFEHIANLKGKTFLIKNIRTFIANSHIILQYLTCNQSMKEDILKLLLEKPTRRRDIEEYTLNCNLVRLDEYSTPRLHNSFTPCKVNGYEFVPLKSIREIRQLGFELNNCLQGFNISRFAADIVAVHYLGKSIAAIEVAGKRVLQARLKENKEINPGSDIGKAIQLACKKNNIRIRFDEEYLPF